MHSIVGSPPVNNGSFFNINRHNYTASAQPHHVTAVDFDDSGTFMAVGLSSGAVSVYIKKGTTFTIHTHFLSHDTDVVRLKWCKGQSVCMLLLVTNVNITRLWKINRPVLSIPTHNNTDGLFARKPLTHGAREILKREFSNLSNTHISHTHSLSLNSDGETFLTSDELRIHLWNLHAGECFNMLDLTPENLHQITEVLRVAEFHPLHCNVLAYGTSAGAVRLCDMREAALCDATCRALGNGENNSKDKENKLTGPLDEYMKGVADIAFSQAGLHLAARDYCQIRLWDLRVEGKPLARYPILPRHQLLAHLYDRYEDGVPLDRFRCTFLGGETLRLATGTYSDQCIIWDVNGDSGGNVVVHVGKDRSSSPVQFQSQLLTAESDYGARQKRRKCVDDFIETPDFGEEYRDGVVSSSPISNVVVRPFGNTRVKTFIGDMKTEYMVQYDNHEMGDGMDELFTNNGYSSPISFGRKVSALVVDGPRDVLAVAATGQLFVYDIKR